MGWTGTQLVAVGGEGAILRSPDASSWIASTPLTIARLAGIGSSDKTIVVVGVAGTILSSTDDAATWVVQTSGTDLDLAGVAWTGSQFVAVGSGVVLLSADGQSWKALPNGSLGNCSAVASSGKGIVAVGASGDIFTSPDGVTWKGPAPSDLGSSKMPGVRSSYLLGVAWLGDRYEAVGNSGAIVKSPEGTL